MEPDLERQTPVEVTAGVSCGDGQRKRGFHRSEVEEVWNKQSSSNSFKLSNLKNLDKT